MKNISSLKSSKNESPKTPGGISKSLLTPCRRIGLSRNWKKAGPSPFVSPLSGSTPGKSEAVVEKRQPRKRKERVKSEENDDEDQCTPETLVPNVDIDESAIPAHTIEDDHLSNTPTRHVEVPRKKKSKTLLSALSKNVQEIEPIGDKQETEVIKPSKEGEDKVNKGQNEESVTPLQRSRSKGKKANSPNISSNKSKENLTSKTDEPLEKTEASNISEPSEDVVTPVLKSKSKGRKILSPKNISKSDDIIFKDNLNEDLVVKKSLQSPDIQDKSTADTEKEPKQRSPNELTKECIVVIQKKIFKTDKKKQKAKTQVSYDSDSDDVSLGQLSKETVVNQIITTPLEQNKVQGDKTENPEIIETINLVDEEDDFIETKKVKIKKLEDKSTSIGGLKKKPKISKPKTPKPPQTMKDVDFDDEDDFDFDNKKTILIRKTYEKAIRAPQRAKSTGSITQKDIDDLKARIEAKKKMLLARAMTEDTEELRSLIKKWQKGCQDALMELMDLMKIKFPDKQNLDYSEMLSMLKIPANLVGYDEDNDCFNTPDDATIVLSKFNDK